MSKEAAISSIAEAVTSNVAGERSLYLGIEGMTCASCVSRVEQAVKAAPGVLDASVNLATERVEIVFAGDRPDLAAVSQAIHEAGYEARGESISLAVTGMTCASCVGRIESAISALPGVTTAHVNLATGRANVEWLAGTVDTARLISAIRGAGFEAEPIDEGSDRADREREAREREIGTLRRSVYVAALLTLPVFLLEMGSHVIPGMHDWVMTVVGHRESRYVQFVLTTLVLFGPGLVFFRKGVSALLRGAPDMNALVALGTGAAWSYSVIATFASGLLPEGKQNVYFEAAAVIVTLILVGRYLEALAKGRTSEAIRRLMGLRAKTARIVRDGREMEVGVEQVQVGDLVQVRPGERVPVDGTVDDGRSYVDESMMTGESAPVLKERGAEVVGGTINKTGAFSFRATRIGADTALAQIIRMVERAQGTKLPIQALVDKVTGVFVPIVIAVALVTFAVWFVFGPDPALTFALVNAVAVLIIACPCAMGLATPTSIMVGMGRAAETGVLFRRGEALQALYGATIVALDKTGTLTRRRPELTDLVTAASFDQIEVLRLVASVERRSEHPVAKAIVAAAETRGLSLAEPRDFEAKPGFGVAAAVGGYRVEIGADRYMQRLGLDIEPFANPAARFGDEAKTPLYVAIDGRLAAIIAVADPVKPATPAAIDVLHAKGLRVAMITGDNRHTANAIARRLGIDEVVAEVLPDGKVDALRRLQTNGATVAFVGDGINDAPALAQADVGLAIGTGTDVAIESADVVLMSGDLRGVPNAIALSRATMINIRQNLFWAFAYNASLIPVAAGVLYPAFGILLSPIFAAAAMAASSVCVLTNALRLRRFTPPLPAESAAATRQAHPDPRSYGRPP